MICGRRSCPKSKLGCFCYFCWVIITFTRVFDDRSLPISKAFHTLPENGLIFFSVRTHTYIYIYIYLYTYICCAIKWCRYLRDRECVVATKRSFTVDASVSGESTAPSTIIQIRPSLQCTNADTAVVVTCNCAKLKCLYMEDALRLPGLIN